jgi:hypothetical protein
MKNEVGIMLLSVSAHSSTLKMKAKYSSKTLVDFQWTKRRYIQKKKQKKHNSSSKQLFQL